MNEQERSELDNLKRLHELLQQQINELGTRIDQFEKLPALPQKANTLDEVQAMEMPELPIPDLPIPPLSIPGESFQSSTRPASAVPPILNPAQLEKTSAVPPIISTRENLAEQLLEARTAVSRPEGTFSSPELIPPKISEPDLSESPRASFEMQLGTYWLVRIGIVVLLTGMVFFARYAYQNYIGQLGPMGKLVLMYLGGGALLGIGFFLQRKQQSKEALKNYGQVLFAGGLALVYFTTYGAHHVPNLRVISSPIVDGVLLLVWTGIIVWYADRKKSEVLALFAISLAYYTSVITSIGLFTLYSNLVLTVAAVFFLLRNRWTRLSFTGLIATYIAFVFWRFHGSEGWIWSRRIEEVLIGNLFLCGYWIVFTASTFLSRNEEKQTFRGPFLTLNNSAFFALIVIPLIRDQSGILWKFSLSFGVVLLGLAGLAKRIFPDDQSVKNSYITQGTLLVTLGFITYFTGLKLALVLAAESVVLFVLGTARNNNVLKAGAYITALLATIYGFNGIIKSPDILTGVSIGALIFFNAFWTRRSISKLEIQRVGLNSSAVFFTLLSLVIWKITTWESSPREWIPAILSLEVILFTFSIYFLRVPELPVLGQGFLLIAQCFRVAENLGHHNESTGWSSAILILTTIGISHWWQRQNRMRVAGDLRNLFQGLYAVAAVGIIFVWLRPMVRPEIWLAVVCLLSVALLVYGLATRFWFLAIASQFLVFYVAGGFKEQLFHGNLSWSIALIPIATLFGLGLAGSIWFRRAFASSDAVGPVRILAAFYRGVALLMTLAWVHRFVPPREQFWVLMLLGALAFALVAKRQNLEAYVFSAIFLGAGLVVFFFRFKNPSVILHWPNIVALFVLPALQQWARRHPETFSLMATGIHAAMICVGALSVWIYLSQLVILNSRGAYLFLTASWAVLALALFAVGLFLKERIYRWLGLTVLGVALGRVFFYDIWKLETIYRILSFMALGLVLLVLGFLYNKYQEKFKNWI